MIDKFKSLLGEDRNKYCVRACIILALLSYGYFVTNNIYNYDSIGVINGKGTALPLGRWSLELIGDAMYGLWGNYNIPLFNAAAAVVFLCAASVVIVRIFDIKNKWLAACIGGITVSFPTIGATMFFSFTVQYYSLAIFLCALGLYYAKRLNVKSLVIAALWFSVALGIYQAYFPFIAAMMILMLISQVIDDKYDAKSVLINSVKMFCTLVLGYVFYLIFMKITLLIFRMKLDSYQGVNQMGKIEFAELPVQIVETLKNYYGVFITDYLSVAGMYFVKVMIAASFVFSAVLLVFCAKKQPLWKRVELGIGMILLAVASNSIIILVPYGYIYTLMSLGLITIFYLPVMLAEKTGTDGNERRRMISMIAVIIVMGSALNYAYQNNGNYIKRKTANDLGENYFVTLTTRIQSSPGYKSDMEVVLVNSEFPNPPENRWWKAPFNYSGAGSNVINESARFHYYYAYTGYNLRYITDDEYGQRRMEIEAMPTYPDDGGIRVIDGLVVVKLV